LHVDPDDAIFAQFRANLVDCLDFAFADFCRGIANDTNLWLIRVIIDDESAGPCSDFCMFLRKQLGNGTLLVLRRVPDGIVPSSFKKGRAQIARPVAPENIRCLRPPHPPAMRSYLIRAIA
jgi:hypothetical protein